jgi:RimJ/RimL family protein N-acetyltransferase
MRQAEARAHLSFPNGDAGQNTRGDGMTEPAGDVVIAAVAPEHVEGLHRAIDIVARERKYLTLFEAFPLPETREFVRDLISKGGLQFVALARGGVVGWCDIRRHPFPSHAHRGALGMGLLPAYRGRGLGRTLLDATLAQAFRSGFVRVELDVRADNARAIALYDRVGFVREGLVRAAVRVDGKYYDAIAMAIVRRGDEAPPP